MSKLRWMFKLVSKSKLKFLFQELHSYLISFISCFHISYFSISLFPGTAFIDRERITSMWNTAPVGRRTDVTLPQVFYTTSSSCLWAWCYMLFVNDDDDYYYYYYHYYYYHYYYLYHYFHYYYYHYYYYYIPYYHYQYYLEYIYSSTSKF